MSTPLHAVASFVNLLALSVLFALLAGTRLALSPVMRKLPPVPWATVQQGLVRTLGRPVPVATAVAGIAPLPVLALLASSGELGGPRFWLTAAGMACTIAVGAATIIASVPLDREVARWNPKAPPANFFQVRERWEKLHTMRTSFVAVALAMQLAAVVWP